MSALKHLFNEKWEIVLISIHNPLYTFISTHCFNVLLLTLKIISSNQNQKVILTLFFKWSSVAQIFKSFYPGFYGITAISSGYGKKSDRWTSLDIKLITIHN